MYRATTPQHRFEFPSELPPMEQQIIRMAYKQGEKLILMKEYDLTDTESYRIVPTEDDGTAYVFTDCRMEGAYLTIRLTQEETKLFDANKTVKIQARILTAKNEVIASDYITVPVKDVLEDDIIEEREA